MIWLLQNTLIAAVLSAVVLLICRFRQIGPAARHVLWLVVLVKLVTPPLVFWPWPVPQFLETPDIATTFESQQSTQSNPRVDGAAPPLSDRKILEEDNVVVSNEWLVVAVESINSNDPELIELVASQQKNSPQAEHLTSLTTGVAASALPWWASFPWRTAIGLVWLFGSALVLLVNLTRIVRMQRRVRLGNPVTGWLDREVKYWAEQLRVSAPEVLSVQGVSSPMLWAPFRPRLLWPESLAAEADADAWRGVIVHELAHIKRKDHWVGWVELLARCLWWWNPLFWCVRHQVRENAELACDAWVVETLPDGRRAYAEALLTVCENFSQTAPLPAIGIGSGARRNLERRLTIILKERVPFQVPRLAMFVVLVLGLLALPAWTQSTPPTAETGSAVRENEDPGASAEAKTVPLSDGGEAAPNLARNGEDVAPETAANGNALNRLSGPKPTPIKGAGAPPRPNAIDFTQPNLPAGLPSSARRTTSSAKRIQVLEQQLRYLELVINGLRDNIPEALKEEFGPLSPRGPDIAKKAQPATPGAPLGLNNPNFPNDVYEPNGRVVQSQTITLQRTTYRLPIERAKALEAFLKQHIKAEVLTISFGNDVRAISAVSGLTAIAESTITITTTPDVQKVIGGLIQIMRKDAPPKPPTFDDSDGEAGEDAAGQVEPDRVQPERSSGNAFRVPESSARLNDAAPDSSEFDQEVKLQSFPAAGSKVIGTKKKLR